MKWRPLLSLFIVSVATAAVGWFFRPGGMPRGDGSDALLFPDFDATTVTRLEVEQWSSNVTLEREGETWSVEGMPADGERVTRVLDILDNLQQGLLVSRNPANQIRYQVNEAGQHIRCFGQQGKKVVDVVIGKSGPDFVSNYVRREGTDEVYLSDRPLMGVFSIAVDDWRAKTDTSAPAATPETTEPQPATNQSQGQKTSQAGKH